MRNASNPNSPNPNFKKGIFYGFITLLAISTHPVISRSRPTILDPFFFAICTVLFEALFDIPFLIKYTIKSRKKQSDLEQDEKNPKNTEINPEINEFWKHSWKFLIIGSIFALAQLLFFLGFETADAITGSIAVKSSIIFTMLFGIIFLKEKVTKTQVSLTIFIFIALIFTFTQGTFILSNINRGTLILMFVPVLWTIGHSLTKPMLRDEIIQPSQIIFLRTTISTIILMSFYFSTNPWSKMELIFNPENFIFIFLISITYLIGHLFWYKSIKNVDLAISSAIQAPQPILTSVLAMIFLSEVLTWYHFVGLIVITSSILLILKNKRKQQLI